MHPLTNEELRRKTWMGLSFGHLGWSNHKGEVAGGGHAHAGGDVRADRWTVIIGGLVGVVLIPVAILAQVVAVAYDNAALAVLSGLWLVLGGLALVACLDGFRNLQN